MLKVLQLKPAEAQSLISVYLIGIATMQLFYGPISDSFGRKPILIIGISVFIVASLAIAFLNNYHELVIMRLIQAIGACVGLTLGRALVGDLFNKQEAGKIFLIIFPFVGVTIAVAPVIGGLLNAAFNWQATFYFTAIFGAILLFLIIFFLKESKPLEHRSPLHPRVILGNYKKIIQIPGFWIYTACVCFGYGAYFSYISESPFLLLQQGFAAKNLGYSFIGLSSTYILGNFTARQVVKKYSIDKALLIGYVIFITGGTLFGLALNLAPHLAIGSLIAISVITFGNGFLLPLGTAGGITINPKLSGSASGVLGFLQLASGAIAAQGIGLLSHHQPAKVGLIMLIIVWSGFIVHLILSKLNKSNLSIV